MNIRSLPLGPMEGFVLSRIDGSASLADIADLTSLELGEVVRIVDKLQTLGVVDWADGNVGFPRATPRTSVPPRGGNTRPPAEPLQKNVTEVPNAAKEPEPGSPVRASIPPAPRLPTMETPIQPPSSEGVAKPESSPAAPDDGIDLPLDRRKRIDDLYFALDLLNHYEVLGISRSADKAKIRSTYFERSKAFHPDTVFRRSVGGYRAKMEAIFSRLTEAYEALGKKKARDEYDAYLESLGETRAAEEALSGEHEVPAALAQPSPPVPTTTREGLVREEAAPAAPVAAPAKQSSPTAEGRRVAKEILQKRMDAMRSQSRSRPGTEPAPVAPVEAPVRTQMDALRDLTSSLRGAAAVTGGLDQVSRYVAEARRAIQNGDLAGGVRSYRLAIAIAPDRADVEREHEKYAQELAVSLADRYETQALYEERYKKWASAATSWAKVVEGRPTDVNALTRAAVTLVEAKGDLHQARRFAQAATEAGPTNAAARRALGQVFAAAGLGLNALRELERAQELDPKDELTKLLLRELAARDLT